jgi:hypothetical protein
VAGVWGVDVNTYREQAFIIGNNTISSSYIHGFLDIRTTGAAYATGYNNVVYGPSINNGSPYGGVAATTGGLVLWDYNCYYLSALTNAWGLDNGSTTYSTLANWQASAQTPDLHSTTANPTFAGTLSAGSGSAQFRLNQSTSPVRAAGATPGRLGGITSGATTDMGCWGYDTSLGTVPTIIGCNFDGLTNQ